jgi:hypothetical protein
MDADFRFEKQGRIPTQKRAILYSPKRIKRVYPQQIKIKTSQI